MYLVRKNLHRCRLSPTFVAWLGLAIGPITAHAQGGGGEYRVECTPETVGFCCPAKDPVSVTVEGDGPGNPDDGLLVEMYLTADKPDLTTVSEISSGGQPADWFAVEQECPENVISALTDAIFIGTDDGADTDGDGTPDRFSEAIDNGERIYTSISTSGGDIWQECDDFLFQYTEVTGDFDIALRFLERSHSTGTGQWGRFGIMVRQELTRESRFVMVQDHLPSNLQPAHCAGRRIHNECGGDDNVFLEPCPIERPEFLRLTRRGNVFQCWVSDAPGLWDGTLDPCQDLHWQSCHLEDWGDTAPATVFVGFANSEQGSGGTAVQLVRYRLLSHIDRPPVLLGKRITWNVTRGELNAPGVTFRVHYPERGTVSLDGAVLLEEDPEGEPEAIVRRTDVRFDPDQSGPVGDLENSHDIGSATGGSTWFEPATGTYTLTGSGTDIWDKGDQFHFAYRSVEGDFTVVARIQERIDPVGVPPSRWGKHGLMARYSCDPNSKYSMLQTHLATFEAGVVEQPIDPPQHAFRVRHLADGPTLADYVVDDGVLPGYPGEIPAPVPDDRIARRPEWMRLVRRGPVIYSYLAFDDPGNPGNPLAWCLVGSDSDPARPDSLLVGMALTAHTGPDGPHGTIRFDNLTVEPNTGESIGCSAASRISTHEFSQPDGEVPGAASAVVAQNLAFSPQVVGGRLRLTDDGIADLANAVWFCTDGQELGTTGFHVEFVAFVSKGGEPGCDPALPPAAGMTLAVVGGACDDPLLAIETLVGEPGDHLGYEGGALRERTVCHPSFAIELDSRVGGGEPPSDPDEGDSCSWHVGLDVNSSVSSAQTNATFGVPGASLPDIHHQDGVRVEVLYQPDGEIRVWLSGRTREGGEVDRLQVLDGGVPPLEGDVLLGFTAATGEEGARQEIDDVRISDLCCELPDRVEIECPGGLFHGDQTVELSAIASGLDAGGASAYRWEIVSGAGRIVGNPQQPQVEIRPTEEVASVAVRVRWGDQICQDDAVAECTLVWQPPGGMRPGDFNADGSFDISDPIALLEFLFLGGASPACGDGSPTLPANLTLLDCNGDGRTDISDAVCNLEFLFLGGEPPVAGTECLALPDCPELCEVP